MCDKTDFNLHLWKDFATYKCIGNSREHELGDDTYSNPFLNHIDLCAGCCHHRAVGQVYVLTSQLLHDGIVGHPAEYKIRVFLL